MLKKSTSWVVFIYAILIMTLGYYAYQQSHSVISLYSGLGCGALLLLSSILMFKGVRWGSYVALTTTALLTTVFSIRYSLTRNGLIAALSVLSAAMLLFLLAKTTKWKR